MCNSVRHIREREFKEFGQNLRKFRFQALITTLVSCARALYVTLFVLKTTLAPDSFIKLSFFIFTRFHIMLTVPFRSEILLYVFIFAQVHLKIPYTDTFFSNVKNVPQKLSLWSRGTIIMDMKARWADEPKTKTKK